MPQEIEYSAEFDFTDDVESWKVNRSGAVDEWVWLRNLGDYTLTTSSKTPSEVFANTSVLTTDTLNYGNNPVRILQDTATYFENTWNLDSMSYISARPYYTSAKGLHSTMSLQLGGGYSASYNYSYDCFGIDFLIAVNHATMEARVIWLLFRTQAHTAIEKYVQSSASQSEYFSLSKFM
ncbi:MAG: hypothetical protein K6F28_09995 [Lachnospiraceae bacterium]|nr:hypothetical protein [Lachnospiraceae bacterium]